MICKIFQMAKPQELLAWLQAVWITDSDGYQDSSHHTWWPFLIIKWVCCRCKWRAQADLLPRPVFWGISGFPQGTDYWRNFFSLINGFSPETLWWVSGYYLGTYPQKSKFCVSQVGTMYSAWVNRKQPGMSDKHSNKHDNLESVFSMWHLDILTVYMLLFWSTLHNALWEQWQYRRLVRKYLE